MNAWSAMSGRRLLRKRASSFLNVEDYLVECERGVEVRDKRRLIEEVLRQEFSDIVVYGD